MYLAIRCNRNNEETTERRRSNRRVQIPELVQIRKQLVKKYGKEFAERAEKNVDAVVNERIIHKLSIQPPNAFLVVNYLKEIAKQYGVNWVPKEPVKPMTAMPAPTGFSVQPGKASGFNNLYTPPNQGADPQYEPQPPVRQVGDTSSTKVPDDVSNMTPPVFDALDKNGDGVLSRDEFQGPPSTSQNLTIPTAQVFTPSGDQIVPPVPGDGDSVADEKILPVPPSQQGDNSLPMPPGPTVNDVSTVNAPVEPSMPSNNSTTSSDVPDFDDLQARFNALRGFK